MTRSLTLPRHDARRLAGAAIYGAALCTLMIAPLIAHRDRVHLSFPALFLAYIVLCAGVWAASRTIPTGDRGVGPVVFAAWLSGAAFLATRSATYPLALMLGAFLCGAAVGALPPVSKRQGGGERLPRVIGTLVTVVAGALAVILAASAESPIAGAIVVAGAAAALVELDDQRSPDRRGWVASLPWSLGALAVLSVVGATNPAVSWLGPVTSHGPRGGGRVALTFDDGPNGEMTLAVLRELEARGVKGTFFLVGKAVEREPEVARRVVADGHLVGNHSYSHDGWRFIQPGYPELGRGERPIAAATGDCPRYYRPPHGTHTPFVWLAAERRGMRLVNWDVSAADWSRTDADGLAREVVEKARGGSIILLHDGIDGIPGADRRVVIEALPAIIDGLRAKGLESVALDELLGEAGERAGCGGG